MNINKIQASLNEAEQKYSVTLYSIADKFHKEVIAPLCVNKGIDFVSGNGTWFFCLDKASNHYERYLGDENDTDDEDIKSAIRTLSITDGIPNGNDFGVYVSSYPPEKYK